METKKAKVTKVTRLDKQDSYGNTTFIIEFENSDRGFFTTQKSEQDKFIVGNVADYEIEKRTGSKGQDYFKVQTPKPADGGNWKNKGKQQPEPKIQFIGFAARYSIDYVIAHSLGMNKFEETFDVIYNKMISKL